MPWLLLADEVYPGISNPKLLSTSADATPAPDSVRLSWWLWPPAPPKTMPVEAGRRMPLPASNRNCLSKAAAALLLLVLEVPPTPAPAATAVARLPLLLLLEEDAAVMPMLGPPSPGGRR